MRAFEFFMNTLRLPIYNIDVDSENMRHLEGVYTCVFKLGIEISLFRDIVVC